MTRCNSCNGVITKTDLECYSCGEPVPGVKISRRVKRNSNQPAAPVTPIGNVLILVSLVLTAVCLLMQARMPVAISGTLAGILFTAKIVTDRRASKRIPLQ